MSNHKLDQADWKWMRAEIAQTIEDELRYVMGALAK